MGLHLNLPVTRNAISTGPLGAGFKVRPARVVGHCISQVFYDDRWNLLDGDMGPFYLLRDNVTLACVLSNSFGFGGTNASIVLKRPDA